MATHAHTPSNRTLEPARCAVDRRSSDQHPSGRAVRHAVETLLRLPHEALADVGERIVDRLDEIDGDSDLEPEVGGACEFEDVCLISHTRGIGDDTDEEDNGDDEPDDDAEFDDYPAMDMPGTEDDACFPNLKDVVAPVDQVETRRLLRQARALRSRRSEKPVKRTRRLLIRDHEQTLNEINQLFSEQLVHEELPL